MVIYKITNLINNKIYIGQTNNYNRRIKEHMNNSTKCDNPLYVDMMKYGKDNFEFKIIDETDNEQKLNDLEKYYIHKYNSNVDGYNIQSGGNVMHIPQYKEKHLRKMRSIAVRTQISKTLKEYRKKNLFSDLHRLHLSEAMKGNHNFGNGDTRSIECYCIDEFGVKHEFHNYKEAAEWWHKAFNPFNCVYNYSTYRRKIVDIMNTGKCSFGRGNNKIIVDNIKWYNI